MINTVKLLRFPFSLLLLPVYLFALSQSHFIHTAHLIFSCIILHLLVYPASNGYNSYNDRDTTSIGGLEHPPEVTKALLYVTFIMDVIALVLSLVFVSTLFCVCVLTYIIVSRLYSYRGIRLKQYPYAGFLTVFIFQGGFTYFMSLVGINDRVPAINSQLLWPVLASSFQIGSVYPLTQIYQHEADKKDGVITLSHRLGYTGTFIFSALNFIVANVFYYLYFQPTALSHFYLLQLFFLPTLIYFGCWFLKVLKDKNNADFKHTMRLNLISALCMNACFTILIFCK